MSPCLLFFIAQDEQTEGRKEDREWAQTLGMSLNPTSVSTEKGMKQLGGSLRARNFAMVSTILYQFISLCTPVWVCVCVLMG